MWFINFQLNSNIFDLLFVCSRTLPVEITNIKIISDESRVLDAICLISIVFVLFLWVLLSRISIVYSNRYVSDFYFEFKVYSCWLLLGVASAVFTRFLFMLSCLSTRLYIVATWKMYDCLIHISTIYSVYLTGRNVAIMRTPSNPTNKTCNITSRSLLDCLLLWINDYGTMRKWALASSLSQPKAKLIENRALQRRIL